jgi:hypothetical protein
MAIVHVIDGYGFRLSREGALDIEDGERIIGHLPPDMLSALLLFLKANGAMTAIRAAERGRERANEGDE